MRKNHSFVIFLMLAPASAFAYIGPGAGVGAIATFLAVALGILLILVGFVWYPLKRILKKQRQTKAKESAIDESESRDR